MTVLTNYYKTKKCHLCQNDFSTRNSCQKYCSYTCAKSARKTQTIYKTKQAERNNHAKFKKEYGDRVGKMTLKCANCKQPYDRYASHVKFRGSTYCSMECKRVGQIKRSSKPQLTKKLDEAYSQYIRYKYAINGFVKCVSCGKTDEVKNMQNGHYVSRVFHSTRWLDNNCHPQCYRCNVALGGNYASYTLFMIDTYGPGVIEELIKLSKVTPKYSKIDIQEKIDFYKLKVREMVDEYKTK